MPTRRSPRAVEKLVQFVASPPEPRRKPARSFQPAVWDHIWECWIQGVIVPLMIASVSAGMAIRGYALLPSRRGWHAYHGWDARLLALSVLGIALLCHVRGSWPSRDRLADHAESAQAVSVGLIVAGLCGMLLHQAYLIFQ